MRAMELGGLGLSMHLGQLQVMYHIWYHRKAGMSCNLLRLSESSNSFRSRLWNRFRIPIPGRALRKAKL